MPRLKLLTRPWCCAVALLAALAVGFAPIPKPKARPDPVKEELNKLRGLWGRSISTDWPQEKLRYGRVCAFSERRLLYLSGSKVSARCTFSLDPVNRPGEMVITEDGRDPTRCAYKLVGDTLTLAYFGDPQAAKHSRPPDTEQREGVVVEVLTLRRRP